MRQIKSLRLVDGDKVDYRYKSTDRSMFIRLMEQRGECNDVLIVRDGWVTDTSFTNVVFEDVVGCQGRAFGQNAAWGLRA